MNLVTIYAFPTYVYEVCEDEDLLAPLCTAVRPVCCSLDLAGSCSLWPSSPTVKCLTSFHVKWHRKGKVKLKLNENEFNVIFRSFVKFGHTEWHVRGITQLSYGSFHIGSNSSTYRTQLRSIICVFDRLPHRDCRSTFELDHDIFDIYSNSLQSEG